MYTYVGYYKYEDDTQQRKIDFVPRATRLCNWKIVGTVDRHRDFI